MSKIKYYYIECFVHNKYSKNIICIGRKYKIYFYKYPNHVSCINLLFMCHATVQVNNSKIIFN